MNYFFKKKRIVSFYLSLLVIMIHNYTIHNFIVACDTKTEALELVNYIFSTGITIGAVPLFFIISGVCCFRNYHLSEYIPKMKRRLKSLVIPYFFWNLIGWLFAVCLFLIKVPGYSYSDNPLLFNNILGALFFHKYYSPFWFILALIIFSMCMPLFDVLTSNKKLSYVVCAIFFILMAIPTIKQYSHEFEGCVFYLIGCIIGKYHLDWFKSCDEVAAGKTIFNRWLLGYMALVLIIVLHCENIITIPVFLISMIKAASAIILWKWFDSVICRIKEKEYMKESFFLYASHKTIVVVFAELMWLINKNNIWIAIPGYFAVFALTTLFLLCIASVMKKFTPRFFSVITGGR